jgi:hypothetical protein
MFPKSLPISLACLLMLSGCSTNPLRSLVCPHVPATLLKKVPEELPPIPTSLTGLPEPKISIKNVLPITTE